MASERGNLLLRALDRYLGIPLVRCAGLCRSPSPPPRALNNIGVLCLGCIGDMVLLSGPLADLTREHPLARLTVFCSKANMDAAHMVPGVAQVVALPVKNPLAAATLVRGYGPFDAWLDSSQWPRLGAIISFAARAQYKVGFMSPGQHRHAVYDAAVLHSKDRHELDNFRALFARLGTTGLALPQLVPPPRAEANLPGETLPDGPYAVLHMYPGGYRSFMKQWPQENWRRVAQTLVERGFTVLLSGGPADSEGNEDFIHSLGAATVINLTGCPLTSTAVALKNAAITISVNTGVMHLAAALNAPLVSLQGPTATLRWGPVARPGRSVALYSSRPCAPCLHLGFEYACEDNACMRDISVEAVLEAVETLLAPKGAP